MHAQLNIPSVVTQHGVTMINVGIQITAKARFELPKLTARVEGRPVSITRQHGPC